MKQFNEQAAQGDILIRRISALPSGAVELTPDGDRHIVTHSETGHHHVIGAKNVRMFQMPADGMPGMISYLEVTAPATLEHMRPHDTHESIRFGEGIYEIRRQREHTPAGWRRVED